MKKISDLFTDEEKKQLSYLGSMLHQEPTEEEQEQQRILDAWVDAKANEIGRAWSQNLNVRKLSSGCRCLADVVFKRFRMPLS